MFWAPWYKVCQRELPLFEQFHQQKKPAQLRLLSIGFANTRTNVEAFVKAGPSIFVFPNGYDEDGGCECLQDQRDANVRSSSMLGYPALSGRGHIHPNSDSCAIVLRSPLQFTGALFLKCPRFSGHGDSEVFTLFGCPRPLDLDGDLPFS